MQNAIVLIIYLATLYVAFAVSAIGFAMMLGGPPWAGSVGQALFLRPLAALANGVIQLISHMLTGTGKLIARLFGGLFTHVVDPLLILLGKALRVVFFPRRR